ALHGSRTGLRLRGRLQVRGPRREPLPIPREPRPDGPGRPAAGLALRGAAATGRSGLTGRRIAGGRASTPAGRALPARLPSASSTLRSSSGSGALVLTVT